MTTSLCRGHGRHFDRCDKGLSIESGIGDLNFHQRWQLNRHKTLREISNGRQEKIAMKIEI